jgi:hypothetical protein
MRFCRDHRPARPTSRRSPPILGTLCPALFAVGTRDALLDDTLFMHACWVAAGNAAELAGFTLFPSEMAKAASARMGAFLVPAQAGTQGFQ